MGLLEVEIAIETVSDDQEGYLQLAELPPGQVLSFLGQYFLSPQVFTILARHIELDDREQAEVQLTASSMLPRKSWKVKIFASLLLGGANRARGKAVSREVSSVAHRGTGARSGCRGVVAATGTREIASYRQGMAAEGVHGALIAVHHLRSTWSSQVLQQLGHRP